MGPVSRPGAGAEAHLAEGGGGGRRGRGCEEAAAGRGGRGRGRGPGAGPGWASAVPAPASCHAVSRCCHGVSRPGMGLVTSWWLGWLLADWVQIMLAWPPPPRQYPAPRVSGRAAHAAWPHCAARARRGRGVWCRAAAAAFLVRVCARWRWCGPRPGSFVFISGEMLGPRHRGRARLLLVCWKHADNLGDTAHHHHHHHTITTTSPPQPPHHHHHHTTNTQTDLQLNRYRICQNLPGCHLKTLGGGTETGSLYRRD